MSEFDKSTIDAIADMTHKSDPLVVVVGELADGRKVSVGALYQGHDRGYSQIDLKAEADKWRTAPERKKGTSTAFSLASFMTLVHRHADPSSAIFADIVSDQPSLTAVFDYHHPTEAAGQGGEPRFGEHRSTYRWPISKEWTAWRKFDGVEMPQGAFAGWLESHISELATAGSADKAYEDDLQMTFGTPAEIFALSRGLEINVASKVNNSVKLANGTGQVVFEESHNGSDGKPLKVPGLFMIAIPLFVGGQFVRLPARLRYRRHSAELLWSYHLYRPEHFVHEALMGDLATVEVETGLPLYEGRPEVV